MTFVSPLFLWALLALAIPIIIHLFNFRKYKKVYFTNVRFLKELQQESKSKSRLKEILILTCRCLAIACLVFAFSQPVWRDQEEKKNVAGTNSLSIYLDNSFSMNNLSRQGPLLQAAKSHAKSIIRAFGNADKFQVITNDFEGKHQRFNTKEDALNIIDEIKISSSVRSLSDVLKRQTDFLNSAGNSNKKIIVFSDAQKSTFNLGEVKADTLIKTTLIPLAANQVNNVFIDSCWFESPLQQKGFIQKLHATIVNKGSANIDVGSARLNLNKQQIALASFSLEANSRTEIKFTFESKFEGFNFGSIKIEDYPITFDDELYFAFNSKVHVAVTLINAKSVLPDNSFASLFGSDSLFNYRSFSEQTIDYGAFKGSDVIILNQLSAMSSGLISELIKFSLKGGAIVIIPPTEPALQSYNEALLALKLPLFGELDSTQLKTDRIEYASKFYSGVFEKIEDRINLPLVTKHYSLQKNTRSDFENILTLQNADAFFGTAKLNNAYLYLFTAPLNEQATNFNKHAMFVPTFYQICFTSLRQLPLSYNVSSNLVITIKNEGSLTEEPPHIRQQEGELDIIPELRVISNVLYLYTRNQINDPGFYNIRRKETDLQPLAFNYSRKESDLGAYTADELQNMINDRYWRFMNVIADTDEDISRQVVQAAEGKKLWKLFIFLALLFVVLEVALLRLLK